MTFTLPNIITLFRFALALPMVWFLAHREYPPAFVVVLIAGFSDAVDGFLAKRFDMASDLGGKLDPLADKFLLICAYLSLSLTGVLPLWLMALVLSRDVLIVAGATYYHYKVAPFEAKPLLLSKLNTVLQIALVLVVLFSLAVLPLAPVVVDVSILVVAVSTALSGLQYVIIWGGKAIEIRRSKQ